MAPVLSHTMMFLLRGDHDHRNNLTGFEIKRQHLGVFHNTLRFITTDAVSILHQRRTFQKTSWEIKGHQE